MLEIEIDPESRAALETNYTARCLCSKKFTLESRQLQNVKIWVDELVEKVCQALLRSLGQDVGPLLKKNR